MPKINAKHKKKEEKNFIVQMKKIISIALSLILTLSLFVGCTDNSVTSTSSETAEIGSDEITVTDALNRQVKVTSCERVACLMGSFADMWCLAGGKSSLVAAADDTWTGFDLKLSDSVSNLGQIKEPNEEILLESEPDLVFASSKLQPDLDLEDTLTQAGISVIYLDVDNFNDYLSTLEMMTSLTGNEEAYKTYGTDLQEEIDSAKAKQDSSNPTVCLLRVIGSSVSVKGSEGTVIGEMLEDLGCKNIADESRYSSLLDNLSLETILEADPEYIFVIYQGDDKDAAMSVLEENVTSNEAWSSLSAVKNNRYYVMDRQLYNLKPNARWGEAYEKLAEILYP